MQGKHLYMWAFLLAAGAISWYEMKDCHRLPWPPRLIYTAMTFGALEITAAFSESITGVMAIGIVIALFVNKGFAFSQYTGQCKEYTGYATTQANGTAYLTDATTANMQQPASVSFAYGVNPTSGAPQSSTVAPSTGGPAGAGTQTV